MRSLYPASPLTLTAALLLAASAFTAQAQGTQNKMGVTEPEVNYQAGGSPLANEAMYQDTTRRRRR